MTKHNSFRTILCPIDFDENSMQALELAADLARIAGARIHVLHVAIPITSCAFQTRLEMSVTEAWDTDEKLTNICRDRLRGISYEVLTRTGDPAIAIVGAAEELKPDLIVIATHSSRSRAKPFVGSVAERVIRQSLAPVVTVRPSASGDPDAVGTHMTPVPVTATPDTTVARVRELMSQNRVRSMPVLRDDRVVGVITDRDITTLDVTSGTAAALLMTRDVVSVSPRTSIQEAARLLLECEVDGLPVIDDGQLVGIITRSDVLQIVAEVATGPRSDTPYSGAGTRPAMRQQSRKLENMKKEK